MEKKILESFIEKCNLGKACEASHWYSDSEKETLTARSHTEEKTVILKVVLKKWQGIESCNLTIPNSTKIKAMLSPLGENVSVILNKIRDKIINFTLSDSDCEAICTIAEYDAFPETPDVDEITVPDNYDVEILLNEEFLDRFNKATAALTEAKDSVVMNNKSGGLDMVINYEDTNTNRIRIPLTTVPNKDKLPVNIGISTEILKSILKVNAECLDVDSKLKISREGLASLLFEDDTFKSTYFLFSTRFF